MSSASRENLIDVNQEGGGIDKQTKSGWRPKPFGLLIPPQEYIPYKEA